MADWPVSLTQGPLLSSYQEEFPDILLRSTMDMGPAKVRRRFTAGVTKITASYILDATDLDTFETFYRTTINSGATAFNYPHPRTLASVVARITKPPSYTPVSGTHYMVDLEMEILP